MLVLGFSQGSGIKHLLVTLWGFNVEFRCNIDSTVGLSMSMGFMGSSIFRYAIARLSCN